MRGPLSLLVLSVIFFGLLHTQFVECRKNHLHDLKDYAEKRIHVAPIKKLWPFNLVPYRFASNLPRDLTRLFKEATSHVSNNSCIRFVEVKSSAEASTYPAVLKVVLSESSSLCAAEGDFAIKTTLKLGKNCGALGLTVPGVIVHEILHILGFKHTQMRTEIPEDKASQFAKGDKRLETGRWPYDPLSILYYSKYANTRHRDRSTIRSEDGLLDETSQVAKGDKRLETGSWPYDPLSILYYSKYANTRHRDRSTIRSEDGPLDNDVMRQGRHMSPFDILELNDAFCEGKVPKTADDFEFLQTLIKEKKAKENSESITSKRATSLFNSKRDQFRARGEEREEEEEEEEEEEYSTKRKRSLVQRLKRVIHGLRKS